MAHLRGRNRISVEEKGQRTTRSTDTYLLKKSPKDPTYCSSCGTVYRNKRWLLDSAELGRMKSEGIASTTVCPACRRIADGNPGGIVTLSGQYLLSHEEEILDSLKQTESRSRSTNPLGRIMEIQQDEDVITITTTEDKLAQKLGRSIFRSHRGELHYRWSHDPNLLRVEWQR